MKYDEKDIIKDVIGKHKKTWENWQYYFSELEEDVQFELGDQWSDSDKEKLAERKQPALSINNIKKPVDLITGFERQNRTNIRVIPIEGTDQAQSDVYSEVIHWIMSDCGGNNNGSIAFHNAVSGGVGWLHPYFTNADDLVNGDIKVDFENPFRIMPDSQMTKLDLKDCDFIFRKAWLSKDKVIEMYPHRAADLKTLKGGDTMQFFIQEPTTKNNEDNLNVVEYWYRKYVKKNFIIDHTVGKLTESNMGDKELKNLKYMIDNYPDEFVPETQTQYKYLEVMTRDIPIIKMQSVAEQKILLYDDVNPFGIDEFPFIPVWAYFNPSYNEWKWKLQGIVRSLKDSQREKNKRRSKLLHSAMTLPFSSWVYKEGSVQDPNVFKRIGDVGQNIPYSGDTPPTAIPPQQISQALVQLEQMHSNDIREIGPNADLLGLSGQQGGSGMNAPGVTLQLRQKQGLTSIQVLFDNYSFAKEMLGKQLIKLINKHFSDEKIQNIIGSPLPEQFSQNKDTARYNCKVDEITDSPTHRAYNFTILADLAQRGYQISPQMLLESSDLPQSTKDKLNQQMQAQAQAQQQQQQLQLQKELQEMEIERQKLLLEAKKVEIEAYRAGLKLELDMSKLDLNKQKMDREEIQKDRDLEKADLDAQGQVAGLAKELLSTGAER